jgi:hypothetical protein
MPRATGTGYLQTPAAGSDVPGDDVEDFVDFLARQREPLLGVDRPQFVPVPGEEVGDLVGRRLVDVLEFPEFRDELA